MDLSERLTHSSYLMARLWHGQQSYGDLPYYYHLQQVHDILFDLGFNGEILDAAYLHDILEDTHCKEDIIILSLVKSYIIMFWL